MEYKVIDNFLPKNNFKIIKDLLFNQNFSWFYHSDIVHEKKESKNMLFYFSHIFYSNHSINSDNFHIINDNLLSFLDVKSLMRVKANLYPNQLIKEKTGSHVDLPYSHKGAIFYINSNNGKTLLGKNIKIDSIENRILFFDPSKEHDTETCTDQKVRVNININYF